MKRLALVAVVLSVVSLGISGWALWHSYDANSTSTNTSVTSTTTHGTTTTTGLVILPTVVGRNVYLASAGLAGVGLKTAIVRAPSVNVLKNYVISQSPLPGTEVPRGTVITLTLSSGPTSG